MATLAAPLLNAQETPQQPNRTSLEETRKKRGNSAWRVAGSYVEGTKATVTTVSKSVLAWCSKATEAKREVTDLEVDDADLQWRLEQVKSVSSGEAARLSFDLNKELNPVIEYKGRLLKGTLLHYALWYSHHLDEEEAESFEVVLKSGANAHAFASYEHGFGKGEVQAVHIACGLGYIPALNALIRHCPLEAVINSPARWTSKSSGQVCDFYMPIHDACFHAEAATICWLIEKRADVTAKDKDGCNTLHVLAKNGGHGEREKESKLAQIVEALFEASQEEVEFGRILDELAFPDAAKPHAREAPTCGGWTPFALAVIAHQFPRKLLYLLVNSYWSVRSGKTSGNIYDDLRQLARGDVEAARKLYDEATFQERNHRGTPIIKVYRDAQEKMAASRIAGLIFLSAPLGTDILDLLLDKPRIVDPSHCPIWAHAQLTNSLWGYEVHMKCSYQGDYREERGVRWPAWSPVPNQNQHRRWHKALFGDINKGNVRGIQGLREVEVKVLMLPGVLDIDMLWALARVPFEHHNVFQKRSIQGIIECTWNDCLHVSRLIFAMRCIDVLVCFVWGCTFVHHQPLSRLTLFSGVQCEHSHAGMGTEGCNSPAHAVPWCIMTADAIRGLTTVIWIFLASWSRRTALEKSRFPNCCCSRRRVFKQEDMMLVMNALWNPKAVLHESRVWLDCLQHVAKLCFLARTQRLDGEPLDNGQQAFLTVIFLMSFYGLLYSARTGLGPGKTLLVLCKTLLRKGIQNVFVITFMVYFAMIIAFCILKRQQGVGWIDEFAFRALMFGDGDGLDHLGLDPDEQETNHTLLTLLMVMGTLVFSILIFNLLIAIYEAEFYAVQRDADKYFQQERARAITKVLLETAAVVPKKVMGGCHTYIFKTGITLCIGTLGFLCCPVWSNLLSWFPWLAASLLAIAENLLISAQALPYSADVYNHEDDDAGQKESDVRMDISEKQKPEQLLVPQPVYGEQPSSERRSRTRRQATLKLGTTTESKDRFLWICQARGREVPEEDRMEVIERKITKLDDHMVANEARMRDLIQGQALLTEAVYSQHKRLFARPVRD